MRERRLDSHCTDQHSCLIRLYLQSFLKLLDSELFLFVACSFHRDDLVYPSISFGGGVLRQRIVGGSVIHLGSRTYCGG
jgi:hypothetical protein